MNPRTIQPRRLATPTVRALLAACLSPLALAGWPPAAQAGDLGVRVHVRPQGQPLGGAAVCLGTGANPAQMGAITTGPGGLARFEDVPAAPLVLTVSKPGFRGVSRPVRTTSGSRQLLVSLARGGGGPVCPSPEPLAARGAVRVLDLGLKVVESAGGTPVIVLEPRLAGRPNQYRIAGDPDFTGAPWQALEDTLRWRPQASGPSAPLYFQVRRHLDEAGVVLEARSPPVAARIPLP